MVTRLIAAALVLLLAGCGGGGGSDIAESPSPAPAGALGTVQLKAMTPSVAEGAGTANIAVTRTGGSTGAVSVAVATEAGSATAGQDFVATSTTVQFADGDAADKTVAIALVNDGIPEGTETRILKIEIPEPWRSWRLGESLSAQRFALLARMRI